MSRAVRIGGLGRDAHRRTHDGIFIDRIGRGIGVADTAPTAPSLTSVTLIVNAWLLVLPSSLVARIVTLWLVLAS